MNYVELIAAVQDYTQNYETAFVANMPVFVKQAEQRIYNTVQLPALRKNVIGTATDGNKYVSCPNDFLSVFSLAVVDGTGSYEYLLNKDVNFLRAVYPSPNDEGLPRYYALFGPTVNNTGITTELSLMLAPTPDDDYTVELHYYYYPESLVQGEIQAFTLAGGTGYTNGIYQNIPLTGGQGTGALANITVAGGAVTNVSIINPGSFYVVGDVLSAGLINGTNFAITLTAISNPTGTSWVSDNYDPVLSYGTLVEAYTFMKGEQDMMTYYETKFKEALSQLVRLGAGLERGDAYRDGQAKNAGGTVIQQGLTTSFKQAILEGTQDLTTGDLKMALYTGLAELGPNTTVYTTTNEVVGTGYTAGGNMLTGMTIQADANTGTVYVNFANLPWPGANFTARGGLIYSPSQSNKSIAVLDFGSDKLFTPANNTITMPPNTATAALIRLP